MPKSRITFDETCVALAPPGDAPAAWEVAWSRVEEVAAWKDDVFAYDIICVGLRTAVDPQYVWCDEEADGWVELIDELDRRFGIGIAWLSRIAQPPFAENRTVLWRSGGARG